MMFKNTPKKIAIVSSFCFMLLALGSVQVAQAERGEIRNEVKDIRGDIKDLREQRKDLREDFNAEREVENERLHDLKNASSTIRRSRLASSTKESLKANFERDREEIKSKVEKLKADIKEKKAENKDLKAKRLDKKASESVSKRVTAIATRFDNQIDRLTKLDTNLEVRIAKIATAGKDTTEATALLVTARDSFASTKTTIAAIKQSAAAETSTSTTSAVFRDLAKKGEDSIKSTTDAYKNVLRAIVKNEDKARFGTSTPERR